MHSCIYALEMFETSHMVFNAPNIKLKANQIGFVLYVPRIDISVKTDAELKIATI